LNAAGDRRNHPRKVTTFHHGPAGWSRKFRRFLSWARGASRGEGYWMIVFAAALLVTVGVFNLIDGIAALARSHIFIANAHYVIGDLRAWGRVALILGVLQVLTAIGVMAGNQVARWFAVAVVGLNAIAQMFFIAAYPW
jgi:hypothetical protein